MNETLTINDETNKHDLTKQEWIIANGNEAAAKAIVQIGYDGEGYFPITPSSEVGEVVNKAKASGASDINFVIGTSELAVAGIITGMSLAGGRAIDATSSQGLLLKGEQMPAIAGMGLPVMLNLATRTISAPLNIKCDHSDLAQTLGWGWIILLAPNVQAVYDFNIIALKLAEAVNLPVIVAYDGFFTSHGTRRIQVFKDSSLITKFIGAPSSRPNALDVKHPHTFGAYMNDDLINTKVVIELKMEKAYELLPELFVAYEAISGRHYGLVETYGNQDAPAGMFILNSAGEATKLAVDELAKTGQTVKTIMPRVLRPYPEKELLHAIGNVKTLIVAERTAQYGAGNYLANEIGASLQKQGSQAKIISRTYGLGGIEFTPEDAKALFQLADKTNGNTGAKDTLNGKWSNRYHGAWPGDPNYNPHPTLAPLTQEECTLNANQTTVNLKKLSAMPPRLEKHSACPGCGIFTNLNLFLRGIDGHVVLVFNTGCGEIVTTGFPLTSFKVPWVHNLFHNGTSTATGLIEMYKRFRGKGLISEDITFVVVTGDGGDDIGMDQVIGAALRNDPMIVLEYDNKGYMNTGNQLCYTGVKGQRFSNANMGPEQKAKTTHHKDIIEILRGTHAPYLFQAAESNPADMIRKARKAQATVRAGGFVFGKVFSVCPLNWGMEETMGPKAVKMAVDSCLHPLYEIENGKTRISYNPEESKRKITVIELFQIMGAVFSHLAKQEYADIADEIQKEVDRRWARLLAMNASPSL